MPPVSKSLTTDTCHHYVEFSSRGSAAQRVKGRTLIAALRAADTVIFVDLDDIAAHAAGDLAQLAFLVGRGLILCADAKGENCTFHAQALHLRHRRMP